MHQSELTWSTGSGCGCPWKNGGSDSGVPHSIHQHLLKLGKPECRACACRGCGRLWLDGGWNSCGQRYCRRARPVTDERWWRWSPGLLHCCFVCSSLISDCYLAQHCLIGVDLARAGAPPFVLSMLNACCYLMM